MKRFWMVTMLILVPVGLVLAAWQAFAYWELDREVSALEREQQQVFEANKRYLAAYMSESSPGRIEQRASKELNMFWPDQNSLVIIEGERKPEDAMQ